MSKPKEILNSLVLRFDTRAPGQGQYWWEVDPAYYVLWLLSKLRIIWNLHPIPRRLAEAT